jgi:hypothetical protein
VSVPDGAFVESKEVVVGSSLIGAADGAEELAIARHAPTAFGVKLRPDLADELTARLGMDAGGAPRRSYLEELTVDARSIGWL